ncbi:MAG: TIM44-like domain-containing protein [Deltaproteobacteria bacterium]|nr:TIM44-like domain-containing protein [Deltaproteobacteria bacterium]
MKKRRPYLDKVKAVLLAGSLWLVMVPAASPWHQGDTCASFSFHKILLTKPVPAAEPRQPQEEASAKSPPPTPPQNIPGQNPWDNLIRLLAGGLLAGVLWSVLFGYPFYTYWPDHPWPLGLLDLSILAVFFYLGYLAVLSARRRRRQPAETPGPAFLKGRDQGPTTLMVAQQAEAGIEEIIASDPEFDLAAFGEYALQVVENLHAAWNLRDLASLNGTVGEDVLQYLRMGLKILDLRGEVSRLEDVSIDRLAVTAAGRENGREFITLRLEGVLLDYILKRKSGKLVSGSLTYPSTLQETWRFERHEGQPWKLVDIQDH